MKNVDRPVVATPVTKDHLLVALTEESLSVQNIDLFMTGYNFHYYHYVIISYIITNI